MHVGRKGRVHLDNLGIVGEELSQFFCRKNNGTAGAIVVARCFRNRLFIKQFEQRIVCVVCKILVEASSNITPT